MNLRRIAVISLLAGLSLIHVFAEDPWTGKDLIQPQNLASQLAQRETSGPVVIFVGFPVLYRNTHLPAAILAGPLAKPEGLEALKMALREIPHDRQIVLYCGCCPFVKCPNVRPAYSALREMGFMKIKVLFIETNLHTDWVAKGYPVEKGS